MAQPLGQKDLEGLADHLLAGVAEQLLGLIVHDLDAAALVHGDDGLRGGLHQGAELGFALRLLAAVEARLRQGLLHLELVHDHAGEIGEGRELVVGQAGMRTGIHHRQHADPIPAGGDQRGAG